ncbi:MULTISPECIES: GntR family transcriptional regulator [Cupriavidus]
MAMAGREKRKQGERGGAPGDMAGLTAERGVSQYQRLAGLIRYRIASGQYALDALLPPITQMAEELGVSVVTVRQAYEKLSEEGLISSHRGRGTFVAAVPGHVDAEIQTAISDPMNDVAGLAFDIHSVGTRADLPPDLTNDVPEPEGFTCVHKVHSLNGEPFCYAEIYIPTVIFRQLPRGVEKRRKLLAVVLEQHRANSCSFRQCTTVAPADFPLCDFLQLPFASPVARMTRRLLAADGRVLYGGIVWYRGDRYMTEIEFPASYLDSLPGISEPRPRKR